MQIKYGDSKVAGDNAGPFSETTNLVINGVRDETLGEKVKRVLAEVRDAVITAGADFQDTQIELQVQQGSDIVNLTLFPGPRK